MTDHCYSPFRQLRDGARDFMQRDDGGATAWSLLWLLNFGVVAGLAIDSTNGWRHKTMLASTADVAALAAAWELPESYLDLPYIPGSYVAAEDEALAYAGANMMSEHHGAYITRNDIVVGNWEPEGRTFTPGDQFPAPGALDVNAVRVNVGESRERDNSVATMLLSLIGFNSWDIQATATAVYGVPLCYKNGIIGREGVDIASNAKILKNVCVHGQLVANVNNNVYWANEKSLSTGFAPAGEWEVSPGQYDADGKLIDLTDANRQNLYPPMVDRIPSIGRAMLNGDNDYRHFVYPSVSAPDVPTVIALPPHFERVDGTAVTSAWLRQDHGVRLASLGGFAGVGALLGLSMTGDTTEDGRTSTFNEVEQRGSKYLWPLDDPTIDPAADGFSTTTEGAPGGPVASLDEDHVYFADSCHPPDGTFAEQYITLGGVIRNITLVTNCAIVISKFGLDGTPTRIENSVLLSTAGSGGGKALMIENGAQLGADSACENWGGIRIYANGDIHVPSSGSGFSQWFGAHLVARADIHFAGQNYSAKGLSLMAGGEVKIEGNATIGALDGALDETYPAGGCPEDGVKQEYSIDAYMPALVD